jgi:regulator of sigma D
MWPFSLLFPSKSKSKQRTVIQTSFVESSLAIKPAPVQVQRFPFNPDLISKLKKDHQELLVVFARIVEASENSQFSEISKNLRELKIAFNGHIVHEETKFYGYLENLFKPAKHATERKIARDLRNEMRGISKAVTDFCEKWITTTVAAESHKDFDGELEAIGEALVTRINLEESTLYTLYVESI